MDVRKAVTAVVCGEFEDAAKQFNINPTVDAWGRLTDAMWARQALTSSETMADQMDDLKAAGVGHWVKMLRRAHEGKAK